MRRTTYWRIGELQKDMITEQQILELIRKITPNSKKYLFDDAAIIEKNLIVTTDTLVENTHFTLETYTPEEIGHKALAVNLSDIAAMGGKPLYALLSLSLPKKITLTWIKRLYKGILSCAKKYKTEIIGGNLTRSKEINITITVIGKTVVKTPRWGVSTRSNAKPGDIVFATGTFGSPAKKPIPQIEIGQKIVGACFKHAPALMDSSDGLADCLIQISEQSKVKIIVEEGKIPKGRNPLNLALYAGEDYQLVGTVSKPDWEKLKKIKGIKIIGEVLKQKGAFLKLSNGMTIKLNANRAFQHFKLRN